MRLSRRQLLVLAAAPPLLAAAGTAAVGLSWWDQPQAAGYRHLSAVEAETLRAFAGAAWPPTAACPLDGELAQLDQYLDQAMADLGELPRQGIRMLLHLLDHLPLPTDGARFRALPREDRGRLLLRWLDGDLPELRSAMQSLVVLTGMGYTSHPGAEGTFATIYRCRYGR